jgi:hypothetical protein
MIIRVGRKDRTVPLGLAKNGAVRVFAEAALVIKISVRFNMHRNLYSWDGARKCTICDSVTVRSARRRTEKEWLARGSLITLPRCASRLLIGV